MTHVITPVEVEQRIALCLDEMEARTQDYRHLAETAAESEAVYRRKHALTVLGVINSHPRMSVMERNARVDAAVNDDYQAYLMSKAARDSCREALTTLRETLSGLRTLSVNTRELARP